MLIKQLIINRHDSLKCVKSELKIIKNPNAIVNIVNNTNATALLWVGDTATPAVTKIYPNAANKINDRKKWSKVIISGFLR